MTNHNRLIQNKEFFATYIDVNSIQNKMAASVLTIFTLWETAISLLVGKRQTCPGLNQLFIAHFEEGYGI